MMRPSGARRGQAASQPGVYEAGYRVLGGAEQYVQIRGEDGANPVVLVLHGGPGSPMSDWSWRWQRELEGRYTIVHWDQRGCGNTYFQSRTGERPTVERLLADLDELVDQLRTQLGREKLLLLGHSWGTFLGGLYVGRQPEKVAAWLPVSQMVDFKGSERCSTQEAARRARAAGKERDARELEAGLERLLACRDFGRNEARVLLALRQKKERHLPSQYGRGMLALRLRSPDRTWNSLRWMFSFGGMVEANRAIYEALLSGGRILPGRYEVPVAMIAGEDDWTTPYPMAREYFSRISAPDKRFVTVSGGHIPFLEEGFVQALSSALDWGWTRGGAKAQAGHKFP